MSEMPCPDCRARGVGGGARIGNQRTECRRCNRFAARVRNRMTRALVQQADPGVVARTREQIEREVYKEMSR